MEIIVVGGGTAGYVTALILKEKFREQANIKIIKSKDIGIIGVGEGTTEHWNDFLKYMNINPQLMIKECGATYKAGIMFKGWGEKDYLHSVDCQYDIFKGQENIGSLSLIHNKKRLAHDSVYESQVRASEPRISQFHFDTFKLNTFLQNLAIKRNIEVIDDIIHQVHTGPKGIASLQSETKTYTANLYIDCTGFKRLLIGKLGAKWKSYKKYLKVNAAFTFQTPDEENYNLWTLAKAMKFGWRFKIPVQGRHGNGYIFCDKYTDVETAKVEVEKELGHEINIAKTFKFDPGRLDKTWIKNCVAVGLAANFVEPLEATSIGTSIQQAYLLMHNLSSPNGAIRQQYNEQVVSIMDNIRDFIYLHYLRWHKHNWFWKNFTWENAPPTLKKMLSIWQRRLPLNDDVKGSDFKLFWGRNYLQVLYGMGMYDYNKEIEKQYNCLSNSYKSMVDHYYKNIMPQNFSDLVSHKEYIRKLNGIPN